MLCLELGSNALMLPTLAKYWIKQLFCFSTVFNRKLYLHVFIQKTIPSNAHEMHFGIAVAIKL